MAILSSIKNGAKKIVGKVADAGGNIVAKASGLSSAQLKSIEEKRAQYLSEKPETDSEGIKRMLGSYAVEAYEAYLPQLSEIYRPMSVSEGEETDDEENLVRRIRYIEITKWVSDPSEDNTDKLTNMYHVLSEEDCNVALIYDRKRTGCKVYLAVVNNRVSDSPVIANVFMERLEAALRGNFPGVEIKTNGESGFGAGILPGLKAADKASVAIVSNISGEKSEKFVNQSMEKLLDGIVPEKEQEEYTVVLLATPVKERLERKNALSELYSKLSVYASWQTTFTFSETTATGSSAAFGANLGGSLGRQAGDTATFGTNSSTSTTEGDSTSATDSQNFSTTDGTNSSTSTGTSNSRNRSDSTGNNSSTSFAETAGENDSITGGVTANQSVEAGVTGGIDFIGEAKVNSSVTAGLSESLSTSHGTNTSTTNTSTAGTSSSSTIGSARTVSETLAQGVSHAETIAKGVSDTITRTRSVSDTIGRIASNAKSFATNVGINFGGSFSRSSNVTVILGKNDALTQSFVNYDVKNTLELIEQQIKRIEQSTSLGMWDFAAYFISDSPIIANNAAHMYLALTQGANSHLSQSAVNLWEYRDEHSKAVENILGFIRRLQQPEFELNVPVDEGEDREWLMYPPHVDATVGLTGRELALSLNFPRKSVSGFPVLESVAFGRDIHRFSENKSEDNGIIIAGNIYHMRKTDENVRVKLDINSLCSHTFITGSTGTGKSNFIYNMLYQLYDEDKHFMVIEPAKGEYKNVLGGFDGVSVYGTNPMYTQMLRINPFSFPKHINVLEHIDRLIEIFNACWPMYAAMPAVLKDAVEKAYKDKGWVFSDPEYYSEDFPTFAQLINILPEIMKGSLYSSDTKSDYSGALITRVKSLSNGINGEIFCGANEISGEELFDKNVIVDISRVGSTETKSLIMGILIMKLQEYRMQPDKMNEQLSHVTVLEEAHNLLRRTSFQQNQESSNLHGKSVEMLSNAIAEMRTYGEGFIIADQAPGMLDESVIRNTNTKIIFRFPDEEDCRLAGKSVSLTEEQIKELSKLPAFVAVIYQNDWVEAVLCKSNKFDKLRKYTYTRRDLNLSIRKFLTNVFELKEKISLSDEEKEDIAGWIMRLDNGNETKELLSKVLNGESITESQRGWVAYNLFDSSKLVIDTIYKAEQNDKGIEAMKTSISKKLRLDGENELVDVIQKYICLAINSEEKYNELSRRYNYFGLKGGLM